MGWPGKHRSRPGPAVLARGLGLATVWWTLTGGELRSWLFGAPLVIAATAASTALNPAAARWRVRPVGLAAFVPYFVWRSLWGSIDVAWRALHPRLPITPAFHAFRLRLPADGPARVFFADTVNLLPGTLNANLDGHRMTVHLLNASSPSAVPELRRLEQKVADLFGVALQPADAGDDTADV